MQRALPPRQAPEERLQVTFRHRWQVVQNEQVCSDDFQLRVFSHNTHDRVVAF